MGSIAERSELWCTRVFDYWVVIPSIQKNTASGIMYIWENSTTITRNSPTIESEIHSISALTKSNSDLYILFAFMGFIVGSFVLFFTFNVSKARLGARKDAAAYVVDLPPRYSEVVPPSYEWVLDHYHSKELYSVSNLSTMVVICSCLLMLLQCC